MLNRRVLVLIGVSVLILGIGATLLRRANEKPKLSFTEGDLQSLENKLNGLNIEDLEGLSIGASTTFTGEELDQLGLKIDGLSFEDLGGLSSP